MIRALMCQQVRCPKCGKATWAGCGRHIEQALAGVPAEKRCTCASAGAAKSAAGDTAAPARPMSILERVFGKKG